MKSLSLLASMAILCSVACKKVALKPVEGHPASAAPTALATTENLGNILKGTNVSWKLHPLSPNNIPLLTYTAKSNSGYAALMIDNGILNGALPVKSIRFITADLKAGTTKTIQIRSKATGLPVESSVGRLTQCVFGINKKFYAATEASPDGGGHLIEYDPFSQTAWDLGQPLQLDGHYLSIFMLNVGADGALYGGSFGSNGDVATFRYDYNTGFSSDKSSIDLDAKYVAYVSGDAKFTYASVGQDKWKLYAIERATGIKKLLMQNDNAYERIEVTSHTDAAYAKLGATHYKLNGFTATSLGTYNTPPTKRNYFVPYELEDATVPTIVWDGIEKRLYYKFPGSTESSIAINDVMEDIYPIGTMVPNNTTLYVNSAKTPLLACYTRNQGFKYIGSGLSIHCMSPSASADGNTMYCGGYPRGFLMEYNVTKTWTLDKQTTSFTPPDVSSSQSNPRKLFQFQDPDQQGTYGCMYLSSLLVTKDGYMVGGGNNDRLTVSTNRELSFGSYKNGVNHNIYLPEFQNYEFTSMCLAADSVSVYIAAIHKYGGKGKIYTYKPATNNVTSSIEVPVGSSPGSIGLYAKGRVIGAINNLLYILDVPSNSVVWKKTLGGGETIFAMTLGPDHSVWIGHMYLNVFNTRIAKILLTTTESGGMLDTMTAVADIKDADQDENTKPSQMVFMPSLQNNRFDLYLSGLKSLYRVNNCAGI